MNKRLRRLSPTLALAAGLLLCSPCVHAFQAAEVAEKPVKKTAQEPEKKTERVTFVSAEKPVTFKQRLEVYNRAKQDKDRLYCREDRMTGSHRKQLRCITYETKELEEDAARAFFRQLGR